MPIRFFYWADAYDAKLRPLLDSARANGIDAQPIGVGRMVRDFHHSLFKQQALFDAVNCLDRDDVVCATDGYDAFYQQNAAYVLNTFTSFGCDVVFSAERGYSHQYARYRRFFDAAATSSPYRYLNAGSVIGFAGALANLYRPSIFLRANVALTRIRGVWRSLDQVKRLAQKLGISPPGNDLNWLGYTDQAVMAKEMALGRKAISIDLDRECRLFWCTAFEWDDIECHHTKAGGQLQNRHTGHTPAIVHVPWPQQRATFQRLFRDVYPQSVALQASDTRPPRNESP